MTIPVSIAPTFDALKSEIVWLHGYWIAYRDLYRKSPERIDFLNESAATFFYMVQRLFLSEIELTISKLTDPARSGSNKNLSLASFLEDARPHLSAPLIAKLEELLNTLIVDAKKLRIKRNKLIAHFDYKSIMQIADPLPTTSAVEIDEFLRLIRDFMNAIEQEYTDATTAYDYFHMTHGPDLLVDRLKGGLLLNELKSSGKVDWQDLLGGKWRDA